MKFPISNFQFSNKFSIGHLSFKIGNFIQENKLEFAILVLILVLGAFLRLYKIADYMTFLGDEGRDAIVVRRLLVDFDPILIGPGTSIGNMYLGPLYYYMVAPALLLANFSPVGPAVMVAILGVATIFLVWWVVREWFPSTPFGRSGQVNWGAFIAAGLYAVSPTVIIYSRSSWNPNIMPFFALLSIYSIWRIWKQNDFKWLIVLGISYAFVLQSHYLGLLLIPTILIFWAGALIRLIRTIRSIRLIKDFLKYSLCSLLLFSFLMSPLVIFDARHGWRNFDAVKKFVSERQTTISARPWSAIPKIYPIFEKVNTRLLAGRDESTGKLTAIVTVGALALLFYSYHRKIRKLNPSYLLLITWMSFALLGLGLYKQEIYDHYYGFFFAAPFLLVGTLTQEIWDRGKLLRIGVLVIISYLILTNLLNSPILLPPQRQMQRAQEVSAKIAQESDGRRFNLAVIAERNYEDGYQYFLEKDGLPVIDIDAQRPETVTDQLFAVCELPPGKCDPTHSPKAEVANFGWSKIENQWEVFGVTIYKLTHSIPKV